MEPHLRPHIKLTPRIKTIPRIKKARLKTFLL